jgi:hypothetical protein
MSEPAARAMRLCLVDPSLRDLAGHPADYARLTMKDARLHGYGSVSAVGHVGASAALEAWVEAPIQPYFPLGLKDDHGGRQSGLRARLAGLPLVGTAVRGLLRAGRTVGLLPAPPSFDQDIMARAALMAGAFRSLFAGLADGPPTALFFPNLTWAEAIEVLAARPPDWPQTHPFHILLRYDPPSDPPARGRLAAGARKAMGGVRWWTDTPALAEAYAATLGAPVSVAPIPLDIEALTAALAAAPARGPKLTVAYLGEARVEKGFTLLPDAVAALAGEVAFLVQASLNPAIADRPVQAAGARLRAMAGPDLAIIEGALPAAGLNAALAAADVLALPYAPQAYGLRSSGLFALGLASGRVMIAPEGAGWMRALAAAQNDAAVIWRSQGQPLAQAIKAAAALAQTRPRPMAAQMPTALVGLPAPWLCEA